MIFLPLTRVAIRRVNVPERNVSNESRATVSSFHGGLNVGFFNWAAISLVPNYSIVNRGKFQGKLISHLLIFMDKIYNILQSLIYSFSRNF